MIRNGSNSVFKNPCNFYFGKIPSRSDFVRSSSGAKVIDLMDQWVAHGMEMLMSTPDWKTSFDGAAPFDFLFLGMRRKYAVCGTMAPSNDASSRRFPLIAATTFDVVDSLNFLQYAPLMLDKVCKERRRLIKLAMESPDSTMPLSLLADRWLHTDIQLGLSKERFAAFATTRTIASMNSLLGLVPGVAHVPQMVLVLAQLLQPLRNPAYARPQKAVSLPLPVDESERACYLSFWIHLVSVFLEGSSIDVSLFSGMHLGTPRLIIAFDGLTPMMYHALFDRYVASSILVDLLHSLEIRRDAPSLQASISLTSHMEHGELTVQQLITSFRNAYAA